MTRVPPPPAQPGPAGRDGTRRPGLRAVPALLALGVVASLAACGSGSGSAPDAGRYPVATPPAELASTPVADSSHYQLVPAGQPVRVHLADADVVVSMSGPEVTQPTDPKAGSASAVETLDIRAERGALHVPASTFLTLGERQQPLPVSPDVKAVDVSVGHPATLHLSGLFPSGHATLTWQPTGHPVATWDFVIETD